MFSGNSQSSILPGSAAMQQQQKTERVECEKSVNSSKEYASQIMKNIQNNFFVFFFARAICCYLSVDYVWLVPW